MVFIKHVCIRENTGIRIVKTSLRAVGVLHVIMQS